MDDGLIYMSKEAYDKLNDQVTALKTTRRREITVQLRDARAHGDLGENAEYEAAKEAQTFNEIRIRELEDKVARSRIIKEEDLPRGIAVLGTTVKIRDLDTAEVIEYMLVSEVEADFAEDKISVSSPVGKGLLGHKQGDRVEIKVPSGLLKYEIVTIARTAK